MTTLVCTSTLGTNRSSVCGRILLPRKEEEAVPSVDGVLYEVLLGGPDPGTGPTPDPPLFLAVVIEGLVYKELNPVPALLVGEEGNGFVLYGLGSGLGRVVQGIGVGAGGIVFIMTNTIHQDRTIRFMSSDCDCSTSSRARPEELSS